LEREPYNLLPYPDDFDDTDEAARADSFQALVCLLEQGNTTLSNSNSSSSAGLDPSLFNE
jgi:condensin complex subunit 1